jgi:multicomponent K+:H+ antiporter subunit D
MTMDNAAVTGGALFYLVSSTLAVCALFLLIELIERGRVAGADVLAVTADALAEGAEDPEPVGVAIPTTMAILGGGFVACALLLAGLPPLTGFAAKVIMLAAMFHGGTPPGAATWTLLALLMASGFAVMVGLMRAGIRVFWVPIESAVPSVRLLELGPVIGLLLLCGGLTVLAGPVAKFMQAAAESLHARQSYVRQVLPASGAPEAVP